MTEYILKGELCPNCARKIEDKLNKHESVKSATLNYIDRSLEVDGDLKKNEVLEIVQSIEPDVVLVDVKHAEDSSQTAEFMEEEEGIDFKSFEFLSILFGGALLILSFVFKNNYIAIASLAISGFVVYKNAIKVLMKGNGLDEQVLMMVSSVGAVLIGEAKEGAAVIVLYRVGEFLTDLAVERATRDLRNTVTKKERRARVVLEDGSTVEKSASDVKVGSKIEVEPFEMVTLDSILLDEYASIDTSSFTGESEPRIFNKGEIISAGSIVVGKKATLEVYKDSDHSLLKQMDDLVREAAKKKSKQEKFLTVFARIYTPIVVGLAVLIAVVPLITKGDFNDAIRKSLAFLVTSCPCSVVLGVPLSYAVGLGALSRQGILVKGSEFIYATSHIKTIGFDKTGTVTENKLSLVKVVKKADVSEEDLKLLMAIGEKRSTHPIATAFKMENAPEPEELSEIPGAGIDFKYQNKSYEIRGGGESLVIHLFEENKLIGEFYLEEKLKDSAMDVIREIKDLNIEPVLVSGDNESKVKALSDILGFEHYKAEMSPSDKLEYMLEKRENGHMSFVGDGINDSAVLEAANVGISMGKMGSDAAITSSDVVIMDDDIRKIPMTIRASRRILKNVKFIVALSLLTKICVLTAIYLGAKNGMYLAVLADVGLSLVCVMIALLNNKCAK